MIENAAKPTRWYYDPTVLIIAGCLVAVVSFGARATMGLFTYPISEAHQWHRETYGFAMAIQNLAWGIFQPIAGGFADKYGTPRVLIVGALIYAAGIALMPFSDTPGLMFLTGGVIAGVGIATASFTLVMASFGRLVPPEKRSWAFGIATAAGSLGQFIFAPLGQAFIAAFGWETALMLIGALVLLIIPLSIPLGAKGASPQAVSPTQPAMTLREAVTKAFGHSSFMLLTAGFFVCGFQIAFVTIHLPAYLIEHGISTWLAASSIAIVGIFNVIGSYSAGIIGGSYSKPYSLTAIYILRSIIIVLFITIPISPASTILFAASLGLLWLSTVPLTMGLVTVMFGTRYVATLYGFVFLSHQVGSFFGVWLGGKFHDLYGSYDAVWWMAIALGIFAAVVNWPIREQRAPAFAT